jgi:hypothetical protein
VTSSYNEMSSAVCLSSSHGSLKVKDELLVVACPKDAGPRSPSPRS